MSLSEQDRLIQMINQIAINNISAGDEQAVAEVVRGHIQKFWSRRMKTQLIELLDDAGDQLEPAARLAGERLRSTRGA